MVKEKNGNYKCGECGFIYRDKEWAQKCEMWCKINHSCNIQITKHSENKLLFPRSPTRSPIRDGPGGPDEKNNLNMEVYR